MEGSGPSGAVTSFGVGLDGLEVLQAERARRVEAARAMFGRQPPEAARDELAGVRVYGQAGDVDERPRRLRHSRPDRELERRIRAALAEAEFAANIDPEEQVAAVLRLIAAQGAPA